MNPVKLERTVVVLVDEQGVEQRLMLKDVPDPTLKQELTLFLISSRLKIKLLRKKIKKENH